MKKEDRIYYIIFGVIAAYFIWQVFLRDAPPIHDPRLDDLNQ